MSLTRAIILYTPILSFTCAQFNLQTFACLLDSQLWFCLPKCVRSFAILELSGNNDSCNSQNVLQLDRHDYCIIHATEKDVFQKINAPRSLYTWYTKTKRGGALLCQPIHHQQEVILCCFPNNQSQIPSQNVLNTTKQTNKDWQPDFKKQYWIVGGRPFVISKSSFHHGPMVILKCEIFMAQDGAMAAPILLFTTDGSRLEIYTAHMLREWFI